MCTVVTAMRARRPAETRSLAQCGARSGLLITTETPSSVAASTMPSRASAVYDLKTPANCTSMVGRAAVSARRNTGAT